MTIAVCVKVHDGLVLASDSASSLLGIMPNQPSAVINVYNNANKIFNLIKGKPIGCSTYGIGSIGQSSISTLMKDLRKRFINENDDFKSNEDCSIKDIAEKLRKFIFEEKYIPALAEYPYLKGMNCGFFVGGYSNNSDLPELWQISISNGECAAPSQIREPAQAGINWAGELEAIWRLVKGYGMGLEPLLINMGMPKEQAGIIIQRIQQPLEAPLVSPPMPIQDAVDLAEYLVHLTIMYSRFMPGAPTVGGPIEIAAITKHEGFKWVKRKHYYNQELNPAEGGEQ